MSGQFNNYGPAAAATGDGPEGEEEVHNVVPYRMALNMYLAVLSKFMHLGLGTHYRVRGFLMQLYNSLASCRLLPPQGTAAGAQAAAARRRGGGSERVKCKEQDGRSDGRMGQLCGQRSGDARDGVPARPPAGRCKKTAEVRSLKKRGKRRATEGPSASER